jgi:hypothetical protein
MSDPSAHSGLLSGRASVNKRARGRPLNTKLVLAVTVTAAFAILAAVSVSLFFFPSNWSLLFTVAVQHRCSHLYVFSRALMKSIPPSCRTLLSQAVRRSVSPRFRVVVQYFASCTADQLLTPCAPLNLENTRAPRR